MGFGIVVYHEFFNDMAGFVELWGGRYFFYAVSFVIDVGSADGVFFVFVVDFLRGVAALVVAVVGPGLPTVVGLLGYYSSAVFSYGGKMPVLLNRSILTHTSYFP